MPEQRINGRSASPSLASGDARIWAPRISWRLLLPTPWRRHCICGRPFWQRPADLVLGCAENATQPAQTGVL